jgi:serine/threonine protein kinase/tetratricopeptide (TPR) repeat protein
LSAPNQSKGDVSGEGGTIAGYRVAHSLGRGSFGEVFEATREGVEGLQKPVALKVLSAELSANKDFSDAFIAAAELAARLGHANIVQVLDVGRDPTSGTPFVAAELIAGLPLSVLLEQLKRSSDPLPTGLAVLIGSEIAKALDHAHRRTDSDGRRLGIVHGDLSPANVFLTWEGQVKVADFCVGDALFRADPDSPILLGKWAHAAPERARGERPGPAADLFSLGIILFELLSGQNPFERPGSDQVRRALGSLAAAPSVRVLVPHAHEQLAQIVEALLTPQASNRTPSAARLHESLMEHGYASGSRFGTSDLQQLLAGLSPKPTTSSPALRSLLDSIHEPSAPEIEVRYESLDGQETLPPAWSEDATLHDATLVVFAFERPAPEETRALLSTILRRYGGRMLAEEPSEVSAVFGLDQPDGRDTESAARSAVLALRTLQHTGIGPSSGLCAARVRLNAEGEPSDSAALAESIAQARALAGRRGWAVADRRSARELRRSFDLEPLGSGRGWVIEELRSEPHGEFVGRRQLLSDVADTLERAHGGRLHVLGLVGAAGIGKTRFLTELVRRLRRGSAKVGFALASCPPGGKREPLSATDAMLRTLCGVREGDSPARLQPVERQLRATGLNEAQAAAVLARLGGGAPASEQPAPIGPVVTQLLASLARDRLHLFAWDDAHELDPETAELLTSVVTALGGTRVVLLFAARPDDEAAFKQIPGYSEIVLAELDEREARRLVALRLGTDRVPDRVFSFFHERAGGHPMFLEELVHEALDEGSIVVSHRFVDKANLEPRAVPRTLRSTLANRIRRLPLDQRNLLIAAAVLGEPIDVAVLAHVAESTVGAVNALSETLEEQDFLRRDDYLTASFNSPLLRELLVADLDEKALQHLHRRAADAYRTVFENPTEIAHRIAHHLERAGDARGAARYFASSGLSSLRAGRFDRAVIELARSISLEVDTIDGGELVLRISALTQAIARCPERQGVIDAVVDVEQQLAKFVELDARTFANLLLDLGKILAQSDREEHARTIFDRVVELSEGWPELCRAALTSAAEISLRRGDFAEALELAERATGLGLGSSAEQHRLLLTQAQALASVERYDDALQALAKAAELAPGADSALACARARTRAIICAFRGDWQGCAEASEEAAEQGRLAGQTREVAANLHNQGEALIRTGELARGYGAIHASLALAEEIGSDRIANFNRLYLAYLDAVDGLPGADEVLASCMAQALRRGWTLDHLTGRYLLGKLLASRGELNAAFRELNAVRSRALELENRPLARDCAYELELFEPTIAEDSES